MKLPIIAEESGDLDFFASPEDAERYVESIDIIHGDVVIYDGDGYVLKVTVVPFDINQPEYGRVRIIDLRLDNKSDFLLILAKEFARKSGCADQLKGVSEVGLALNILVKVFGYTK